MRLTEIRPSPTCAWSKQGISIIRNASKLKWRIGSHNRRNWSFNVFRAPWPLLGGAASQGIEFRQAGSDPQEIFVRQVLRSVEHHIDDALHQGPADHRGDGYEQVESEAQERGRVKGPLPRRLDLGFVC